MFESSIGDIIYTLYNGFYEQIIPMMKKFVIYLFEPLDSILGPIADLPGLGFIGAMLDIVVSLFGDYSLFEIMIGSGFTLYMIFTLFRYFWGTTDYIT